VEEVGGCVSGGGGVVLVMYKMMVSLSLIRGWGVDAPVTLNL
jgi:hypothetical protein